MKTTKILAFMLSVFLLLGLMWWWFPENGIHVGDYTLRFANVHQDMNAHQPDNIDVDSLLDQSTQTFEEALSSADRENLDYFREYLTSNKNRIILPEDDYTYFDAVFRDFENANKQKQTYRIMHYGDSQIELDRISSMLREKMQTLFGGHGVGMVPAIETVPTYSIRQDASGSISNYIVYGNDPELHISHKRYGVMGKMAKLNGGATLSFKSLNDTYTQSHVKSFSKITLLVGNAKNFTATVKCDTFPKVKQTRNVELGDVDTLEFHFPNPVHRASITLSGSAEIYAVLLDGVSGVAVDNDAMRGCWGTVFTNMNTDILKKSFKLLNTRLIILQFGGNGMPGMTSSKAISNYMSELQEQIDTLKHAAPHCTFLFIGPADMGKRVNGNMQTWPRLPETNDSLKALALRNHMAYWDMFHAMGGENSMEQWVNHNPPLGGPDYIHFSQRGACEIGTMLSNSLQTYYKFYQIRQSIPNDSVINFIRKKTASPKRNQSEDTVRTKKDIQNNNQK